MLGHTARISTAAAIAVTGGVIVAGNLVVAAGRHLNPNNREVVTLVAIPSIAIAALGGLRLAGLSSADLGITRGSGQRLGPWRRPALVLGAAAAGATIAVLASGGTARNGADLRLATLRLIVGTALGEELLHRGALLGMWAATGRRPAIIAAVNCAAFGAWHLAGAAPKGWLHGTFDVVGAALGGGLFLWARARSRSIAGAWLLHLTTNLPGLPAH
jgi:membrane protease YdiL (CAAX protease family)